MTKINRTLEPILQRVQNGTVQGGALVTPGELAELKDEIKSGSLPVWRAPGGTSLSQLRDDVDKLPLLPAEREALKSAVDQLESTATKYASSTELGARFGELTHRALSKAEGAKDAFVGAARAVGQRAFGPARIDDGEIAAARASGDPRRQAAVLRGLTSPYAKAGTDGAERAHKMRALLEGASESQVEQIRARYIEDNGTDPFIDIIGGGFAQSILSARTQGSLNLGELARRFAKRPQDGFKNVEEWAVSTYQKIVTDPTTGPDETTRALAQAWLAPEMSARASELGALLDKVEAGQPLSVEDRKAYFGAMPFIGIRTKSERPNNEATLEEQVLQSVWKERGSDTSLEDAMARVEGAFPPLDLPQPRPGQKSVAVVVSSQGAQWQELMGYVMEMQRNDVHVQFFTPEGRPAAFQRDSLSRSNTSNLGFGTPPELDVAGPAGEVARELLSTAVGADRFDPKAFDQVYVAGGLGLNEDGVRVEERDAKDRAAGVQEGPESVYSAQPDLAAMINGAAAEGTPVLAICHGPSVFLADNIDLDVDGAKMAALGPFEAYVAFTGRTGRPFPHMALVHNDARRMGVDVDPVRDAFKPDGVVRDTVRTPSGGELTIVTGPHPRSARGLGLAGLELLGIEADEARYLAR